MTKNEKELVAKIQNILTRKKIEGTASEMFTVEKKSNSHYVATVTIGDLSYSAKGKDNKEAIKNIIKELKWTTPT